MFTKIVVGALLALGAQSAALANATIPTKDIAGAKDNPSIKRYEGSFIVSYQRETFTDFKVPLSSLEPTDRRDGMNNRLHLPKKEMELEGAKTRLAYLIPAERSPLEVLRNYEDVVKAAGGADSVFLQGRYLRRRSEPLELRWRRRLQPHDVLPGGERAQGCELFQRLLRANVEHRRSALLHRSNSTELG